MQNPEVITFGETMALMVPDAPKGIEFAGKLEQSFGGTESNVAIGLARLGHRVGWFGRLGADPLGRMILKRIRGEGIDVSRAALAAEEQTGLMLREIKGGRLSVYYYRRHSAMSRMQPAHLDESYFKGARLLHLTGITPALSDTCRETVWAAVKLAKRHGVKISFDPNLRLKLWGIEEARATLLPLAEEADYFVPGLDELQLLYGTEDFGSILEQVGRLRAATVIKGGNGTSYLLDNGQLQEIPYELVRDPVDPVGAGDAFCAGFLAGVLRGVPLKEAVEWGNAAGTAVIRTAGDWEGLPTWEELTADLQRRKHIER